MSVAAERLFRAPCRFVAAAARVEQLPAAELPEIAFLGRSNVGKSSLINALTGQRALARTSGTPGRTQTLVFFDLGGRLMLVDLPGYGYARASRARMHGVGTSVWAYLEGRAALRRLLILIDARHGLKDTDRATLARLDGAAIAYQLVLTKADKVSPGALAETRETMAAELVRRPAAHPALAVTSAIDGRGLDELRAALAALARPSSPPAGAAKPIAL